VFYVLFIFTVFRRGKASLEIALHGACDRRWILYIFASRFRYKQNCI